MSRPLTTSGLATAALLCSPLFAQDAVENWIQPAGSTDQCSFQPHTSSSEPRNFNRNNVIRATWTAAPKEDLPGNGNDLVDTKKVGYVLWRNLSRATTPARTRIYDLDFARTQDGGKTWTHQTIYSNWDTELVAEFRMVAVGHAVFVFLRTNNANPATTNTNPTPGEYNIFCIWSHDQGKTWSTGTSETNPVFPTPTGPLLVNTTTGPTADQVTGTATNGDAQSFAVAGGMFRGFPRAYVAYEFGNAVEEPFFAAVELLGPTGSVKVSDIKLVDPGSVPSPATSGDVDELRIAADGERVFVAWLQHTSNGNNQMLGNWSKDGGATWGQNPSQLPNWGKIDPDTSKSWTQEKWTFDHEVAIDGDNLYAVWGERKNSKTDHKAEIFFARSSDFGATPFTVQVLSSYAPGAAGVFGKQMVAANGMVAIVAETDEMRSIHVPPPPVIANPSDVNNIEVFVSNDAGVTFKSHILTGQPTATNLIDVDYPDVAIKGDVVHVAWEESHYNETVFSSTTNLPLEAWDDLMMSVSYDGGQTFSTPINVTDNGSIKAGVARPAAPYGDVDHCHLSVTGEGVALVGYRHNSPVGTSTSRRNYPYVAVRAPYLFGTPMEISAASGGTHEMIVKAGSSNAGLGYFIAGSLSGTSPGVMLGQAMVPLNPDPYTDISILAANTAVLVNTKGTLDSNGEARAQLVAPPVSASAVGLNFHHAYIVNQGPNILMGSNATRMLIVQ